MVKDMPPRQEVDRVQETSWSTPEDSAEGSLGPEKPHRFKVCVFITAVPITKLFACVGGETMEDMCYEREGGERERELR